MNIKENITENLVIGSDHAGFLLKEEIKSFLIKKLNFKAENIKDIGTDSEKSVDYPDFGIKLAQLISEKEFEKGILLCGTGIGMSIVANKFKGVRAALCNDLFSAIMSRKHNDSNILVFGGRLIGKDLALEIVKSWLFTSFEAGRHQERLNKINCL